MDDDHRLYKKKKNNWWKIIYHYCLICIEKFHIIIIFSTYAYRKPAQTDSPNDSNR